MLDYIEENVDGNKGFEEENRRLREEIEELQKLLHAKVEDY